MARLQSLRAFGGSARLNPPRFTCFSQHAESSSFGKHDAATGTWSESFQDFTEYPGRLSRGDRALGPERKKPPLWGGFLGV
jgi:hypothetical protein